MSYPYDLPHGVTRQRANIVEFQCVRCGHSDAIIAPMGDSDISDDDAMKALLDPAWEKHFAERPDGIICYLCITDEEVAYRHRQHDITYLRDDAVLLSLEEREHRARAAAGLAHEIPASSPETAGSLLCSPPVMLTPEQRAMIAAHMEAGNTSDAQRVILDALNTAADDE